MALVEEGGADVNVQTGDTGDTPLMLSVSEAVPAQETGSMFMFLTYSRFEEATMRLLVTC